MARKFLTNIDLALNELLNAVVQNLASDPSGAGLVEGLIWFNTTSKQYKYYDGSAVQVVGTSGGSVTDVTGTNGQGFTVGVTNGTSTPAIEVGTSVTGLLKGNGTTASAATSGTDYAPATSGSSILKGNGSGAFSNAVSNTDYAPAVSPTFTGTVTVPSTVNATDAAQKQYVDAAIQGLQFKPTATVAATTALPAGTYSNGSSGVGATFTVTATGTTTVDGHVLAANDLVLVAAQASAFQNGLYTVSTAGTTGVSTVLTRHADMDQSAEFSGAMVPVGSTGTANSNSLWLANPSGTVTVGTTNIPLTELNKATDLAAGTGIGISGNTVSLVTPVSSSDGGAGTVSGILKANGSGTVSSAKYTATIGDGSSTSIAVTHSLGTRDVVVAVYDASTYVEYECDVTRTSTSVVTLGFATAPASSSLNVVVIG